MRSFAHASHSGVASPPFDPSDLHISPTRFLGAVSRARTSSPSPPNPQPPPLLDSSAVSRALPFARCVSAGTYGEVRMGSWHGQAVAVKILKNAADSLLCAFFLREVALTRRVHHPNVVRFLGAKTDAMPFMLVTEMLPMGDLHDYIQSKSPLGARQVLLFALDIARAMEYLHGLSPPIVHRDLKPQYTASLPFPPMPCHAASHLCSLSAHPPRIPNPPACPIRPLRPPHAATDRYMAPEAPLHGPRDRYMAPEVFRHEPYGTAVDVFSFAVLLHEMFEGGQQMKLLTPQEVARKYSLNVRPIFKARTYPPHVKDICTLHVHCFPTARLPVSLLPSTPPTPPPLSLIRHAYPPFHLSAPASPTTHLPHFPCDPLPHSPPAPFPDQLHSDLLATGPTPPHPAHPSPESPPSESPLKSKTPTPCPTLPLPPPIITSFIATCWLAPGPIAAPTLLQDPLFLWRLKSKQKPVSHSPFVPPPITSFIATCWHQDPLQRPPFSRIRHFLEQTLEALGPSPLSSLHHTATHTASGNAGTGSGGGGGFGGGCGGGNGGNRHSHFTRALNAMRDAGASAGNGLTGVDDGTQRVGDGMCRQVPCNIM
ncbi:unnamed protein product [Closterium sp. Naga37s-1]|nr:unnamed protein product [Closterium sp. Naga37s-1]